MKNKFLSFIFAFCLIAASAVTFVACGDDPPDEDTPKYNITLDANGGTLPTGQSTTIVVEKDKKVDWPKVPTKVGHDFIGWTLDAAGNEYYKFDTEIVSKDVTLYAQYIEEDTYTYELNAETNTYVITGGTDSLTRVITPVMHNGKTVSAIGEMAFSEITGVDEYGQSIIKGHENVAELIVMPNIEKIGLGAFAYCKTLETIYIYDGCTTIEHEVFEGNDKLTSVRLPETLTTMGQLVFDDCDTLTSIKIPDSITVLPRSTFSFCKSLTTIQFSNGLTSIGEYCFEDTLISSFNFPSTLTSIKTGAFWGTKLTNVTIPASVQSMGMSVFADCKDLVSVTFMGNVSLSNAPNDDWGMFTGCTNLKTVNLPDTFTSIPRYMFSRCYSLESFTLPRDCTFIGDHAFYHCTNLTNFTFNEKLETISDKAFVGSAITVNYLPDSIKYLGEYIFNHFTEGSNCNLNLYKLPESLEFIDYHALEGATPYINSLPTGLISIYGPYAFGDAFYASKIEIPEGTVTIFDSAFYSARVNKVVLPQGLKSIGDEAFRFSNLTEINIPASVTHIGEYAFANCENLTKITFEGTNIDIDPTAFANTNDAGILTIGSDVTEITAEQYKNSDYTIAIIPGNVKKIGKSAFENCTHLKQVIFKEGLEIIDEDAFKGCTSITNIDIPDSVTSVGKGAFYGMDSLQFLELGTNFNYEGCTFDEIFSLDKSLIEINNKSSKDLSSYINENSSILNIYNGNTENSAIVTDAEYKWFITDTEVILLKCLTKFNEYTTNTLVLPDKKDGRDYRIGDSAFAEIDNLNKVVLPSGLISIGKSAFECCEDLEEINIPSTITRIEDRTFYKCYSLTVIGLPDTIVYIGDYAIGSSSITNLNLTDNLKELGYNALSACVALPITTYNEIDYIGPASNPYLIAIQTTFSAETTKLTFHEDCKFITMWASRTSGYIDEIFIHSGIKSVDMQLDYDYYISRCNIFIAQPTEIESWKFVQNWQYGIDPMSTNFNIYWNTKELKTNDTFKYFITFDNTVTILGMAEEQTSSYDLVIPETIDNCTVTAIGNHAFERDPFGFKYISTLTLNDNIKYIGDYAFYGAACHITITKNIEYIGDYAFAGTWALTPGARRLFLPKTLDYVGSHAFEVYEEYSEFIMPIYVEEGVDFNKWATDWAYVNEETEKYPNVITGIKYWGNNGNGYYYAIFSDDSVGIVYYGGSSEYTDTSNIPSDTSWQGEGSEPGTLEISYPITKICQFAFLEAGYWENIIIPNTIVIIEDYAFCGLNGNLTLNNGLKSIGKHAFGISIYSSQPTPDADLVGGFPSTLTTIEDYGFAGVVIPEDYIIPTTLLNLGEGALYTVSGTYRTVFSSKPDGWHNSWSDKIVYWGFTGTYSTTDYTFGLMSNNTAVILKRLTMIDNEIQSLRLPDTVSVGTETYTITEIGYEAFFNGNGNDRFFWRNIDLIIPYTYKRIANRAFVNEWMNITIEDTAENPSCLTYIGDYAFYICNSSAFTSIVLPNSLQYIGQSAFESCSSLASITIPDTVSYIGNYAFKNTAITTIIVPGCIDVFIDEYACNYIFEGANNLQTIIYSEGIGIINMYYYNVPTVTTIVVPTSLTTIHSLPSDNLSKVLYLGTMEEFQAIENSDRFLEEVPELLYLYSETEPTDSTYKYWHYDTDGVTPIIWE